MELIELYEGETRTIAGDFTYDLSLIGGTLTNGTLKVYLDGVEQNDMIIAGPVIDGNYVKADVKATTAEKVYMLSWEADAGGQHIVVPGELITLSKK